MNKLDTVLSIAFSTTQWKDWSPSRQQRELIEIGLCLIDGTTLEVAEPQRLLIRPERSEVSAFCTANTGVTAEEAAGGQALADVLEVVHYDVKGRKRAWVSWDVGDARELARLCRDAREPYPLSSAHIPLETLVGLQLGLDAEAGIDDCVAKLGRPPLPSKRAVDKAHAVAQMFAAFLAGTR